jgi:glutamate-1-semialdehyde aminotransferase/3-oxoacyl-(acyl-carrier-protein) synthase/acyl carrier protein
METPTKNKFDNFTPLQKAYFRIEKLKQEIAEKKDNKAKGEVAIIGMALRFPGASSPDEFWQVLANEASCIGDLSHKRRTQLHTYLAAKGIDAATYSFPPYGYLSEIDMFPASEFGITDHEALLMHPLQRGFLQVASEAFANAGYPAERIRGSKTGIFAGLSGDQSVSSYMEMLELAGMPVNRATIPANLTALVPARIAHWFDLSGPAIMVDTTCSSSLVAIHQACQSLSAGECDMALAGGIRLHLCPTNKHAIGFESPSGITKAFSNDADGAGIGEGIAAILLKPLADAIRDRDPIHGVIMGSAINHDGATSSLISPSFDAQKDVLTEAWKNAGIDPSKLTYIEAHGTGTPLGDPIEIDALKAAMAPFAKPGMQCGIGSVKSNLGHLFEAAGIAGVIKVILSMQKQIIPASLHVKEVNKELGLENSSFYIAAKSCDWISKEQLYAGVSAFGISGTNCHIVLGSADKIYNENIPAHFPAEQFRGRSYWPEIAANTIVVHQPNNAVAQSEKNVKETLGEIIFRCTGLATNEIESDRPLLELGIDSLVLLQMMDNIKSILGVELRINQFFEEVSTFQRLEKYVEEKSPGVRPEEKTGTTISIAISPGQKENTEGTAWKSFKACLLEEQKPFSAQQSDFLQHFITEYNRRTAASKKFTTENRKQLADWITTIDFRSALKELQYPIVSSRSAGSTFRDIDGNTYIDLAIGYGANFFGNNCAFINEAITEQVTLGFELATQTRLAGEAAAMINRLTGVERVAFCNTGSEAVMTALRIARSRTGRKKIVLFRGSYHGTFDGVLGVPEKQHDEQITVPIAPGIPAGMIEDVIILNYGSPEALLTIRENCSMFAAVLVEPVQSRKPSLQPLDFLRELRQITAEGGTALIFDEMITGFRICKGGFQEWSGITADLVTYGKIAGGGMPIGIVAGKSGFMDAIDGGEWNFGDASFPEVPMTFFGGTFCKHPLTMAACIAALGRIEREGDELYKRVNGLTARFANEANLFFIAEGIPLEVTFFSSQFRIETSGKYNVLLQPVELPLFFYLLMHFGVFTWERRICFFSAAHTDDDADAVLAAVKKAALTLRKAGFFADAQQEQTSPVSQVKNANDRFPLSAEQQNILQFLRAFPGQATAFHELRALHITGEFRKDILQASVKVLMKRHEALRTSSIDMNGQSCSGFEALPVYFHQPKANLTGDDELQEWLSEQFRKPFDLNTGPLFRVDLFEVRKNEYLLSAVFHHLIADGWSMGLFWKELIQVYDEYCVADNPPAWKSASGLASFINWKENVHEALRVEDKTFWKDRLSIVWPALQIGAARELIAANAGNRIRVVFPAELYQQLKKTAAQENTTLFMLMFAGYSILLQGITGEEKLSIATPVAGQTLMGALDLFGNCIAMLPLRLHLHNGITFRGLLGEVRKEMLQTMVNARSWIALSGSPELPVPPRINIAIDMNSIRSLGSFRECKCTPYPVDVSESKYDLALSIIEIEDESLVVEMEYNPLLLKAETVNSWIRILQHILVNGCAMPATPVSSLRLTGEDALQKKTAKWKKKI